MSDPFPSAEDFEYAARYLRATTFGSAEWLTKRVAAAAALRRAYDAKVADFEAVCEERNIAEAKLAEALYDVGVAEDQLAFAEAEVRAAEAQLATVTEERDTLRVAHTAARMRIRTLLQPTP